MQVQRHETVGSPTWTWFCLFWILILGWPAMIPGRRGSVSRPRFAYLIFLASVIYMWPHRQRGRQGVVGRAN